MSQYSILATSRTPALIIYLLDLSRSMGQPIGGIPKIESVRHALDQTLMTMVRRSTKGSLVTPRYRIAVYGYHSTFVDILGGIRSVSEINGLPSFPNLDYGAQTAQAFEQIEQMLQKELPNLSACPAPLICHLTDGMNAGANPEPVVSRIKQMKTEDGSVLVENIFISQSVLKAPIVDVTRWRGVAERDQIFSEKKYANQLFNMSSIVPDSYLDVVKEYGYNLQSGSRMLFPGDHPDIVKLGFTMSGSTPVTK